VVVLIDATKSPVLVTSALLYVNGPLHLGHIRSTYIPADVYTRYLRLKGVPVVFVSGSDEHGTPTVVTAEQEGLTAKAMVDKYHNLAFKNYQALGLSFDHYSRTSNETNHQTTQELFMILKEKGFVFKQIVKEYYCPTDKKFLPDRYIKGECPYCHAKDQYSDYCENCGKTFKPGDLIGAYCSLDKTTPELKDSEHFMFKLSAFSSALSSYLKNQLDVRDEVRNYVLQWIKEGLRDWDIVRDLDWGVKVPGMKGKVFYVWFDAPIGYIAATKEWAEKNGKKDAWKQFWIKAEAEKKGAKIVHFIGKDIVYHHALFWPALLMGTADYKTPDVLPVRGFVTIQGKKISKSRKYWILVEDYLKRWPPDYVRFYYTLTTPNAPTDGDFDWKDFQEKINTELLGNVGNFVHRVLTFIDSKFAGKVPKVPHGSKAGADEVAIKKKLVKSVKEVDKLYSQIELDRALKAILDLSQSFNQYFQHKAPWRADEKDASITLWHCANFVRSLAILLEPVIPFSAEKIWSYLNLEGSVHDADFDSAKDLPIKADHSIKKPLPLFSKAEDDAIQEEIRKLESLIAPPPKESRHGPER